MTLGEAGLKGEEVAMTDALCGTLRAFLRIYM
jgi:hypothetical protein